MNRWLILEDIFAIVVKVEPEQLCLIWIRATVYDSM